MLSHDSKFMRQEADAQMGAYGINPMKTPTIAMQEAGNYKLGRVNFHGLNLAIENPRGSYRGSDYKYRINDHYGYISGYKGADGDFVDVFIGANVSSQKVFVINQDNEQGAFDEHKVMLGYDRLQQAVLAYQLNYDNGWQGLGSVVECSITQLKFWLDRGDKSKALRSQDLPEGGDWELRQAIKGIKWIDDTPTMPIEQLLYRMRRGGNLIMDAVTVDDLLYGAEIVPVFDALISPFGKLKPKMDAMKKALIRANSDMIDNDSPIEITPPFKRYGSLQVASVFTLKDGQTVSIFFHNPDSTPNKIKGDDQMVSWKWMLNKKDITIAVAPEEGKDLAVNEVAKRVMALAKKNATAFAKANAKKTEKVNNVKALKTEIAELEQRERDLIEQVKGFAPDVTDKDGGKISTMHNETIPIVNDVGAGAIDDNSTTPLQAGITNIDDEEAIENLNWLDKADPVATMKGDEVPHFDRTMKLYEWVGDYWSSKSGGVINRSDLGEVTIDAKAAKFSGQHGLGKTKAQAFYLVPEALQKGRLLGKLPEVKGKPEAFIIAAPIGIGEKTYRLLMEVRRDANMQRLYIHEAVLRDEKSPMASFKNSAEHSEGIKLPTQPKGDIYNFMLNLREKQAKYNSPPEVVNTGDALVQKTAREIIGENAKAKTIFTIANDRVTQLVDELIALGWTIYQPDKDGFTLESPVDHTVLSVSSDFDIDDSLFIEIDGDKQDYTGGDYAREGALVRLAERLTQEDAENYLENSDDFYLNEDGTVDHYGDDFENGDGIFDQKTIQFVMSATALEQAVKDENGVILWGDYEATLHNQTLFDSTAHYGVTAQIGKDSRVYGRAGIDKDGMITIYQGANGDTVFGTAKRKPQIVQLVKALFAVKKP